ncbi:hypothetical protein M758_11G149900 [Ceratodon purpureus]|uniref:Peptidase A1 domain-containing protein n=1 Tax=Ceratodon purpureus TaxID=3225 RepID=A0A8T0GF49_CERPU|nr:hypothetical protein KC19_11G173800 [Ceratodon purpureus]KAG0601943.1 hypothetical protein M758_11G149900 [Ceratodon purpureus]
MVELPTITLSFSGRAKLEVLRPYVLISDPEDNILAICLTILDSKSTYSIIGHNFMVNHSITFDRVKKRISWIQVPSCYKYQTSDADKDQAAWMLIATIIMLSSCFIIIRNSSRNN